MVPTSQLHAHDLLDEGRSWIEPSPGMKRFADLESNYSSYVPKKCIYEFLRVHKNGGASCIQLITTTVEIVAARKTIFRLDENLILIESENVN